MKLTDYCSQYYANKVRALRNAGLTALLAVVAQQATAAPSIYFDVNSTTTGSGVVTGTTYSWESTKWDTVSAGTGTSIAFTEGDFARFAAGTDATTKSYTVTANSDHLIGGMYLQANGGGTVTVNGTGVLNIDPTGGPVQGFLVSGAAQTLNILSSLGGTGGVENELSGSLNLYGNNSYSGGTILGTSAGLNFNNANSFGTGAITWGVAQQVIADPTATAPITLGNAMNTRAASTLIIVTPSAAPVTSSGAWTLSAGGTTSTLTGGATASTTATSFTISGTISGAGNLAFTSGSTAHPAVFTLSGSGNNYTGTTAATGVNLLLSSANAAGTSTGMTLSGATLAVSGTQTMASAPLTMSASSSIAFDVGGSATAFANSATSAWTGVLNLTSWDPTIDSLRFGTDATGLTATQLGDIQFDGVGGEASIDSSGFIHAVPEPTTLALGVMGAFGFLARRKKA